MRTGRFCGSCESSIRLTAKFCGKCGFQQRKDPSYTELPEVQSAGGFCGSCETSLIAKYSPCPNCGHVKTTFNPQPNPGNPNPPQCTDQKKVEELGFWESLFLVLTTQPDYTENNNEQTA